MVRLGGSKVGLKKRLKAGEGEGKGKGKEREGASLRRRKGGEGD